MRHGVKTKKIKFGRDANRMLLRKLARNFFLRGVITTTEAKAKFLKPHLETLSSYIRKNTEASRNMLDRKLADRRLIIKLSKEISPKLQTKISGFISIKKLGIRESDGSKMVSVKWSFPKETISK